MVYFYKNWLFEWIPKQSWSVCLVLGELFWDNIYMYFKDKYSVWNPTIQWDFCIGNNVASKTLSWLSDATARCNCFNQRLIILNDCSVGNFNGKSSCLYVYPSCVETGTSAQCWLEFKWQYLGLLQRNQIGCMFCYSQVNGQRYRNLYFIKSSGIHYIRKHTLFWLTGRLLTTVCVTNN